ncbi:MAG: helix-turn-helix domain containing protein [Nitrospirae bacterium]|nr:helix-turn-helix domain containing protein [Nitrospirota bacterium]
MGRKAQGIDISEEEKEALMMFEENDDNKLSVRAKVVMLASQGKSLREISMETDLNQKNCGKWLRRYRVFGIEGLNDKQRRGRPPVIDYKRKILVIELANSAPPAGYLKWSCRSLSRRTGLGSATVNRILREVKYSNN